MCEMGSAFVELQPTDYAVVGEIFGDARFRNAEMIGELGLYGFRTTPRGTAPQKIADGDAECLASLDVIVASQIGIGENEYAWTNRRADAVVELDRFAGEQTAKLHFEQAEARGEARVTVAALNAGTTEVRRSIDGKRGNGTARGKTGRRWFINERVDGRRAGSARGRVTGPTRPARRLATRGRGDEMGGGGWAFRAIAPATAPAPASFWVRGSSSRRA